MEVQRRPVCIRGPFAWQGPALLSCTALLALLCGACASMRQHDAVASGSRTQSTSDLVGEASGPDSAPDWQEKYRGRSAAELEREFLRMYGEYVSRTKQVALQCIADGAWTTVDPHNLGFQVFPSSGVPTDGVTVIVDDGRPHPVAVFIPRVELPVSALELDEMRWLWIHKEARRPR